MKKPNLNRLENEVDKKYRKKDEKRKKKMKISGGKVKDLQRIIRKNSTRL